jgi:hypothetical protein
MAQPRGRGRVRLVDMTAHATGGDREPPTQPQPAAVPLEYPINPLQRLILQRLRERGWSYGEVARRGGLPRSTVYTLATTEPGQAAPPGHDRCAGQGPRRARLRGPRRRSRVHRTALLRQRSDRAAAAGRPGTGPLDRQHRRAHARGPAACSRAGRVAAEQGLDAADRSLTSPLHRRRPRPGPGAVALRPVFVWTLLLHRPARGLS